MFGTILMMVASEEGFPWRVIRQLEFKRPDRNMPLFEYHCSDCNRIVELLVRSEDQPTCPHCRTANLQKLMSASAVKVTAPQLPMVGCPPADAPPCHPYCCRLPQE